MIKLAEHKSQTEHKTIQASSLPARVYLPLSQHLGKICSAEVAVGDMVLKGQRIAAANAGVYAPIHASLSGKVAAIKDWPHPLLGRCPAIVIESDLADKTIATQTPRPRNEIDTLTPGQIRAEVFAAGIVGLGGASFPTHIKLTPPKPIDSLIINGAECEPYLTSDDRLMVEKTKEIILGIQLIEKCLGAKHVYIAIETNKPQAIKIFKELLGNSGYKLYILKSQYPQGGEKQLIQSVLKRQVPEGKFPFDIGVVVQNVATSYAIYEALYLRKTLYERVITISGDCLKNPGNLLARLGTPIKDLIAQCGPLTKTPKQIIFGGPMMGIAQYSQDVPVIKNTNGILLLSEAQVKESQENTCIRCGRCVEYCPLGLMPCLMSMAGEKEKWDLAKSYGCLDCMECGLCNYVCPQKRNIVQTIKTSKIRIPK
ncbi:MAG: electron transport complex subunit RsxC [Candidatus Omnitrophota bacterium]|jgi:electron transport complex protein RnfC